METIKSSAGITTTPAAEIRLPSITACETAVGPTIEWVGNCFSVASQLLEAGLLTGKLRYGHWLGPINPRSFFANRDSVGFVQHGWVEAGDQIIDPTRWVFEAVEPYIFAGPAAGYYDVGGNRFRTSIMQSRPIPKFEEGKGAVPRPEVAIACVLTSPDDRISRLQAHWLCNQDPDLFRGEEAVLMRWMTLHRMQALFPFDNRQLLTERANAT